MINLKSSEDMYIQFLSMIRRDHTSVVSFELWNALINIAALEWVRSKMPENQFTQKRIDDLQMLHVDTDGEFHPYIPVKGELGGDRFLFQMPLPTVNKIGGYEYPEYLHGISAMFKIIYSKSDCHGDGISPLLPASYLRSDQRQEWLNNEYRKPKDTRLYYENVSGFVRLATGYASGLSESTGRYMRLEYYRYPNEILFFGHDNPQNKDSEFTPIINQEILSIAVMNFLEKREEQRLQSFMAVEGTKNRSK